MDSIKNIFAIPELRKRVLFTFGLLAIYRIGGHIPTPGINTQALQTMTAQAASGLFGLYDMFSGRSLSQMTIFALGVMPYISASIILQLLTVVWPYLERLSKEGELGRRKITQYTRYGTIGLSLVQSLGIAFYLEKYTNIAGGYPLVYDPGWAFRLMTVMTLTTGSVLVMWIGEQITERGIGNGMSLLIYAGIVVGLPHGALTTLHQFETGEMGIIRLLVLLVIMIAVVGAVVFVERAHRMTLASRDARQYARLRYRITLFELIASPALLWLYYATGQPADGASGAEVVGGFLMVGTITGSLMALFLNNGGGAWDNAKKYIEAGAYGGKKSDPHKAAVVGDTVGDPFKDTAGPSLHVLIKLLSTITLVMAPLFL